MMDRVDFFPGFDEHRIVVGDVTLYARIGGAGPPLVLLHGYPQSHAMWRRVASRLAERFTTVIPDLRGYGASSIPASQKGEGYSKRVMGVDIVALMQALGHQRFSLAGHDRGGRVGYRLALDHPERIESLAALDIIPTGEMWRGMDAARAMSVYHWMFLAQPEALPETLIGRAPREYIDHTLASWTAAKSLDCFGEALDAYREAFADPARIHATCEDYRAGATIDRTADEADLAAGRKIAAPLLVLWGESGIPAAGTSPLDLWRRWASDVRGHRVAGGHFLPEEAPEATAKALLDFFTRGKT
jgi:haloacetate dehalogenase